MRSAAFVLAALAIAGFSSAASARTVKMNVKVLMKVPKTCTVGAPVSFRLDAAGRPVLTLESFVSDCSMDQIPAILTVVRNASDKGTDVVTIDF